MRRWRGWGARGAAAGAVGWALAACGNAQSPSALKPAGSSARHIASAWWLMFAMAIGVYAVVAGLIVFALLRGRGTERGRPSRWSDDAFIWVGGIAVPVIILAVLATVTVTTTNALRTPAKDPLRVDVIGHDWWWEVRYPGRDITSANELHVPVGQPIAIRLTTADVIHSFWVPQLAGKMDLIPGQPNTLEFTVTKEGRYRGQCAEFCGIQHANMAFLVFAQQPGDFERWAAREEQPHTELPSQRAEEGQLVFERNACAGCHTIKGTPAQGRAGPDLSDFGLRTTIAAGTAANETRNLADWIRDPQSIKPGATMPPTDLSQRELDAVIEYLESQR